MKPGDICRSVFGLAVRLLGLYFLYIGLRDLDVPALMDVTIVKGDNANDVFSAALSVLFNLGVAWWLLGSRLLTLRAYPASAKCLGYSNLSAEQVPPMARFSPTSVLTEAESTEKKLAALIKTPKADRAM